MAIPQDLENLGHRLDAQAQGLERVGERLSDYVASGRGRIEQTRRLWQVGAGAAGLGFLLGVALLLGLARFLPYGLDTGLAAMVVGESRWSAAAVLMAEADFERYVLGYGAEQMARAQQRGVEAVRRGGAGERRGAGVHASGAGAGAVLPTRAGAVGGRRGAVGSAAHSH